MAGDSAGSHIADQTAMVCTESASVTRLALQAVSEVLAWPAWCCAAASTT